ncbi:MAG: laccase domain-containing protein [Lachnospiraceae bacterium]|nr:laccase domain-containing protein [Lachnospiraceae bacterium]MDD7327916.1 laccase domain-containing protein [Lachnospiraceae bacterium]MDY2760058.1 laccase domain-containing protein [Lachnospiraceae bacterium]
MTNVPGIVPGIFSADCAPLIFIDPVQKLLTLAGMEA